jgi:uncharacterized RDD family membrane protein YckC
MKNIEITTTQNVTIQYGLASVWERAIALAIDVAVISTVSSIVLGLQSWLFPYASDIVLYLVILPFILLYSLIFEQFNNGQSLGKMALRLRVIRLDGEKANFLDYLMRWIFRALDIYFSFGGVAVLTVISSTNSQRIGDLLANTVVVNVGKAERMKLDNLLKLNKMDKYVVTYPQVIHLPENAMLTVKETLTKYAKHNNFAHQKALDLLVEKMEQELELKAPENKVQFLKILLKDYIVLTR